MSESNSNESSCAICFLPFTMTRHRLASLKCGHLFGDTCIQRWLKTESCNRRCPKCNLPSEPKDIRVIYGDSVVFLNSLEIKKLKKDLGKCKKQLNELTVSLASKENEIIELKKKISAKDKLINGSKSSEIEMQLYLDRWAKKLYDSVEFPCRNNLNIANQQRFCNYRKIDLKPIICQMMSISKTLDIIIIACMSNTAHKRTFGIRNFSLKEHLTLRHAVGTNDNFIHLHNDEIKDMKLNRSNDKILLTVSSDKQVKAFDLENLKLLAFFHFDPEPMSIDWNLDQTDHNRFFVGCFSGELLECCIRTNSILRKCKLSDKPITNLNLLNFTRSQDDRKFFLINALDQAFTCVLDYSKIDEKLGIEIKEFTLDGFCFSTNALISNKNVLQNLATNAHLVDSDDLLVLSVSANELTQLKITTHFVYKIEIKDNVMSCVHVQSYFENSYRNPNQMKTVRSRLFEHPSKLDSFILCSVDYHQGAMICWEREDEKPLQRFLNFKYTDDSHRYVDSAFIQTDSFGSFLILLSKGHLEFYKYS